MEEDKLRSIKEPLRTSFRQLMDRCEKAGIEYDLEKFLEGEYWLILYLPSGRDKRKIVLADLEDSQELNQVEFEKYVFVPGYRAICSRQDGLIEAYVRVLRPFPTAVMFARLLNITYKEVKDRSKDQLVFELRGQAGKGDPATITISYPSNTMLALGGLVEGEVLPSEAKVLPSK